ncbi:nucleoporin complex subunit 54-domain-containing protein [Haematococcus lacustris]
MAFNFPKPAFGTPQPAATGGSFFGSPLGAAPASPAPSFGFGASSAPAFGSPAPSTTTSLFGTPAGANASPLGFGATAAGTSLFGASAAATNPFGASAPAFGATGAAATSAPAFNLFGSTAPATPPSNTNIFGTPTTSAPAAGGLFGSTTPGGSSLFGLQPTQQQQQQQALVIAQPQPQPDSAVKSITEIKAAYTPSSQSFRFQHLMLNVVESAAQRVVPPGVDGMRWRQALASAGGPDNPDRLWPVVASGFSDLVQRSAAQSQALEENSARLKALNDLAAAISKKHHGELKQRAAEVQRRHVELSHRLLHVYRLLDGLEARLAASIGYQSDAARTREAKLSQQLGVLEAEVDPRYHLSLGQRLRSVAAAARLQHGSSLNSAASQARLDDRSAAQLQAILKDHAEAIAKLQVLLKRDAVDVEIMVKESGRNRLTAMSGPRRLL